MRSLLVEFPSTETIWFRFMSFFKKHVGSFVSPSWLIDEINETAIRDGLQFCRSFMQYFAPSKKRSVQPLWLVGFLSASFNSEILPLIHRHKLKGTA